MTRTAARTLLAVLAATMLMASPTAAAVQSEPAPTPVEAAARLALAAVVPEDRFLGRADAPVTVVEYASFTCPHCAAWHSQVLPDFKARFIDTGKVRLVFRDLPTSPHPLAVAGASLARCAAPEAFFDVAASLMQGQAAVRAGGDPNVWLRTAAAKAGRPIPELQACMNDPATEAAVSAGAEAALAAGITGTPMFLVNGVLLDGASLAHLEAAITPLLPPGS